MTRNTIATLDELWQTVIPRLTPEEQRSGIVLLEELSKGEPIDVAQLAQSLGVSVSEAEQLLGESGLAPFVYREGEGPVEGFFGLATSPTAHRFTIDGRILWTWCAQDSLFLPELLGLAARVESRDPETGEVIHLTVSPAGVVTVEPSGVTVSMVRADTVDLTSAGRVIASACHFIFFFASRESGERWVAAHPPTELLSLEEAVAFGRRQNSRVFGQELARRAHERTPG